MQEAWLSVPGRPSWYSHRPAPVRRYVPGRTTSFWDGSGGTQQRSGLGQTQADELRLATCCAIMHATTVQHLSGEESACISARHKVITPSSDGLACRLRAMKRYTAGRTAMSAPSTMQAKQMRTDVRNLTKPRDGAMPSQAHQQVTSIYWIVLVTLFTGGRHCLRAISIPIQLWRCRPGPI